MGAVIKAVNRAYDRIETRPFWKLRLTAIVLVFATGLTTAGMFLLIVFGGSLGDAVVARTGLGDNFKLIWNIARWPIAFVAVAALLRLRLPPGAEHRARAGAGAHRARWSAR
jgi:membrane protein